ncbi:hypothetical protein SADUNF_Sadunf06G0172200 [Salix dunnii]|uniref:Uncharacterized protein n=1 Tax=Salix dunnii TaxID=1413687 RepID=A0A835K9U4_9ROSI|nr:hypothetical protein SADUNF_Sadunf06G0172200 [Salix dunnii]
MGLFNISTAYGIVHSILFSAYHLIFSYRDKSGSSIRSSTVWKPVWCLNARPENIKKVIRNAISCQSNCYKLSAVPAPPFRNDSVAIGAANLC